MVIIKKMFLNYLELKTYKMKKLLFVAFCLSISFTACREDKKAEKKTVVKTENNVNIETPKGSVKTDGDGNVDIKIKDN